MDHKHKPLSHDPPVGMDPSPPSYMSQYGNNKSYHHPNPYLNTPLPPLPPTNPYQQYNDNPFMEPPHYQQVPPAQIQQYPIEKSYYDSSEDESTPVKSNVPTRVFHVYRDPDGPKLHRRRVFMAADKTTIEFYVSCHRRGMFSTSSADVMVHRGDKDGPVIGEVVLHLMSPTKVDASTRPLPTHGGQLRRFALRGESAFKGRFHVNFGNLGGKFIWKHTTDKVSRLSVGNLKFVQDGTGMILARFYGSSHKSIKKIGRFEVYGERIYDETWLAAVITTGMGMVERDQRERGE